MKRHSFLFFCIFFLSFVQLSISADTKDVALLFKSTGKVEILQTNDETWNTGKRGFRLNSGDKIRTGDQSLAAILFTDDKSLMKVRSNSNLLIQGERQKTSIVKRVYLDVGDVFVSVTKQRSTFRLETPTGVAAVKGTEFYLNVDENGITIIHLINGLLEFMANNDLGTVTLQPGETLFADGENPPKIEKTDSNNSPNWGNEDEGKQPDELEIQIETPEGIKKIKIRIKSEE